MGILSVFVVGLRCVTSPSAVAWFVVPVVVDSIYSESLRTFPHVFEKGVEVFLLSTELDTSTAVVFVSGMSLLVTSVFHFCPESIETLAICSFRIKGSSASTGFGVTRVEVPITGNNRSATVAHTVPDEFVIFTSGLVNYSDSVKLLPSDVNELRYSFMDLLFVIAATALSVSTAKFIAAYSYLVAAFTLAKPREFFPLFAIKFNDSEATKCLVSDVYSPAHDLIPSYLIKGKRSTVNRGVVT